MSILLLWRMQVAAATPKWCSRRRRRRQRQRQRQVERLLSQSHWQKCCKPIGSGRICHISAPPTAIPPPSTPPPLSLAAYDASCWSVEVTITIRPTGHKIKMLHCALPSFPTSPSSSSPLPFPFLVSLLQPRGALIKNAINAIKRRANID